MPDPEEAPEYIPEADVVAPEFIPLRVRMSDVGFLQELVGSGALGEVVVKYMRDMIIRITKEISDNAHVVGDTRDAIHLALAAVEKDTTIVGDKSEIEGALEEALGFCDERT